MYVIKVISRCQRSYITQNRIDLFKDYYWWKHENNLPHRCMETKRVSEYLFARIVIFVGPLLWHPGITNNRAQSINTVAQPWPQFIRTAYYFNGTNKTLDEVCTNKSNQFGYRILIGNNSNEIHGSSSKYCTRHDNSAAITYAQFDGNLISRSLNQVASNATPRETPTRMTKMLAYTAEHWGLLFTANLTRWIRFNTQCISYQPIFIKRHHFYRWIYMHTYTHVHIQ